MVYKEFEYDKKIIRGFLHENKKSNDIVIMLHGFTGNKSDHHFMFRTFADEIFKNNFSVYRFDFLGSGDSDGSFYDCESIEYQIKQTIHIVNHFKTDGYNVHLFGFSMGGVVASQLTKYENISSLFLLSPAGNFDEILKNLIKKSNLYNNTYDIDGFEINEEFILEAYGFDYFDGLENFKNSVKIVQGTNDELVTEESLSNFKDKFSNCKVTHVEGADHCFKSKLYTETVRKEICDFYNEIKHLAN